MAGIGPGGREMVTLTVSEKADALTSHKVAFLTDTGAECNLLPLDIYKDVAGNHFLNLLDARGKLVLFLGNGY